MPTYYRDDNKPVVHFDPQIEITPFTLFRRLREGRAPVVVDIRQVPSKRTLEGAIHNPNPDWQPEGDEQVVLFCDDGTKSVALAQQLQEKGFSEVRALFGGLDLYEFALDPDVVGQATFLQHITDIGT